MMNIENVNMWLTVASICVTCISIGCSIWSFLSAKKAGEYKESVLVLKDTLDLRNVLSLFMTESMHFMNDTRHVEWYKGKNVDNIISPFLKALLSFGDIYHMVKTTSALKEKVNYLQRLVQHYDINSVDSHKKKETEKLIFDIIEILQRELSSYAKEAT